MIKTLKPPLGARLNKQHPLAKDLAGAWLLNEGGGSLALDSAGDKNGTFQNNAAWKIGSKGLGATFPTDNGSDRITLGSITSADRISGYGSQEITVVAAVYLERTPNNSYPRIFDKSSAGSGAGGWAIN